MSNDHKEPHDDAWAPTIGVIMLDEGYGRDEFDSARDSTSVNGRPVGFMEHPRTWATRVIYRVASGCTPPESASASRAAVEGLRSAAEALAGRVDIITTNCAYTWFASEAFEGLETPVLPSGVGLLALARSCGRPTVLLVSHSPTVHKLMGSVPADVRIVGLEDESEWHRFHHDLDRAGDPLDVGLMARQVASRIERDVRSHGSPATVVLECSGLPQFRQVVLSSYRRPVFDLVTSMYAALGVDAPTVEARLAVGARSR